MKKQITDWLITEDHQYVAQAGRVNTLDLVVDHGDGAKIWDVDGNQYIDLLASAASVNVGHNNSEVQKAIQEQSQNLIHYISGYFYNEPAIKLAKRLAELAPGNTPKKVSFSTSGSEAAEAIVKFARAYTNRPYIITFSNSWHGTTMGAASLSAIDPNMHRNIGPLVGDVIHIPHPDQIHNHDDAEGTQSFEFLQELVKHDIPADQIAAIIIEPIQGDAGIIKAPVKYMNKLYQFCHTNGILFCTDEINQGFGRSGKMWSLDHFNLEPDIMAVGKALASGMPLSAVIGKAPIMDSLQAPANATTTAANPICCAAALATIDYIERHHLPERSKELGEYVKAIIEPWNSEFDSIVDIRMIGLNGGIELNSDELAHKISQYVFEHGVIMITTMGNILRFQPPLVISKDELTQALNTVHDAFTNLK